MDQARGASDGVRFAHGMNLLAESLDALGGVDVTELPGVGLEEDVLSLLASTRRLGAVQAAVTDRFATTGAWADSGARTARAVEADERQRDSEAYLHLSPISHGMWRLDGLLPAEVGTHLSALLTAARRRLRAEAKQAALSAATDRKSTMPRSRSNGP